MIHSYTKDLSGTGSVIAGVVIGRNEDMFLPKGQQSGGVSWDQTLFWNVYYVKGAFLNSDAAFEVLQGVRTLNSMLGWRHQHADSGRCAQQPSGDQVHRNAVVDNPTRPARVAHVRLPAPLFTTEMPTVPRAAFQRFFDNLSPTFGHMISLGQSNTIVSCPALTTHSELSEPDLAAADIRPTTIRFAVGDEDPRDLLAHLIETARFTIDPEVPGFAAAFPSADEIARLIRETYLDVHRRYIEEKTS